MEAAGGKVGGAVKLETLLQSKEEVPLSPEPGAGLWVGLRALRGHRAPRLAGGSPSG